MNDQSTEASNAATPGQKQIVVQKIYVKDLSFESPNVPQVFSGDWTPQTQLNLRSSHRMVADDAHEVVLTLTVEAKHGDKTAFLVEMQQAGVFGLTGFDESEREAALGSFCPNVLYPYAREGIASIIQRGGFPEFILQPIDFDALYRQSRAEREAAAAQVN